MIIPKTTPLSTTPYVGDLPKWLAVAFKVALDSTHPQHQMGCVVIKSGRILALAANHADWGKHSETRALSRINDAEGSTVYVMRSNRRISKPCPMCMTLLRERKVRRAVYINQMGLIEEYFFNADV